MTLTLTGINRYPVKSCRGHAVPNAVVEPWGLAGDRRWMLIDDLGEAVTAREYPRLILVTPGVTPGGLVVSGPDMEPLRVAAPSGDLVRVQLWHSNFEAALAAPEAHAWFSKVTGASVRLVYLDDPTRRPTDIDYSTADDRVSLADGFPLLLATEESLAALNEHILDGPNAAVAPLPMWRFRPNVVTTGSTAWDEDNWRRVRIGDATFRAVKSCSRCVLTTIDHETGVKGKEPIATLARHRKWDGKTWFAINLIPEGAGATIRVGDSVEVLDRVPASDSVAGEPQRGESQRK